MLLYGTKNWLERFIAGESDLLRMVVVPVGPVVFVVGWSKLGWTLGDVCKLLFARWGLLLAFTFRFKFEFTLLPGEYVGLAVT